MADTKKYYWLKLPKDFFQDKAIKKLRQIAGGDTYTIIYLKMLLSSLEDNGKLYYEGIEDSIADEIALEIDESEDDVQVVINYLVSKGLMQVTDDFAELLRMNEMIGSETDKAKLMRKVRAKRKAEQIEVVETPLIENVDATWTQSSIDKNSADKKEIKRKFGEHLRVKLTDKQYLDLLEKYGEKALNEHIKILDNWIEMTGKINHYKNYSLAIQGWVHKKWSEDHAKQIRLDDKFYEHKAEQTAEETQAETQRLQQLLKEGRL